MHLDVDGGHCLQDLHRPCRFCKGLGHSYSVDAVWSRRAWSVCLVMAMLITRIDDCTSIVAGNQAVLSICSPHARMPTANSSSSRSGGPWISSIIYESVPACKQPSSFRSIITTVNTHVLPPLLPPIPSPLLMSSGSILPVPLPPRTPSPLSDDTSFHHKRVDGLGIDNSHDPPPSIRTDYDYDIHAGISESPEKTPRFSRTADSMLFPTSTTSSMIPGGLSPQNGPYSPTTPQTASTDGGFHSADPGAGGGFNFVPQQYVAGRTITSKSSNDAIGRRKGHKYRHSSIHASAMEFIIQAPLAHRTPLAVPASLPIPTRKEAWRAMTSNQTARLSWCLCHFLVSAYVQFSGSGSLSMTALSRLLLFDAAGATVCVAVDVMGNFEVWKRSSIKHPFGLERIDVLAGFGMAVFIAFMGLDIISHGIQHSLENLGSHVPHTAHAHSRVTTSSVNAASFLAIGSTLVSALLLQNHARIGRAMRFEMIAGWGRILENPSHFLTLSCSLLVLVLPFLSQQTYKVVDFVFSIFIALLMITFGVRLGTSLSNMLLMSYTSPNNSVHNLMTEIEQSLGPSSVQEARFWQVHYGLCMANVKLRCQGAMGGEEVVSVRDRVVKMVKSRLGDGKAVRWDVNVQVAVGRD